MKDAVDTLSASVLIAYGFVSFFFFLLLCARLRKMLALCTHLDENKCLMKGLPCTFTYSRGEKLLRDMAGTVISSVRFLKRRARTCTAFLNATIVYRTSSCGTGSVRL